MENSTPIVDYLDPKEQRNEYGRRYMRSRYAANPERHKENSRKWAQKNRERTRVNQRKRYAANKEKISNIVRKSRLKLDFNISLEQYECMLSEQKGVCAICKQPCPSGNKLSIDHDHRCCNTKSKSCGKCIRGLLCVHCNRGLGCLRDSPELLLEAFQYIKRHMK